MYVGGELRNCKLCFSGCVTITCHNLHSYSVSTDFFSPCSTTEKACGTYFDILYFKAIAFVELSERAQEYITTSFVRMINAMMIKRQLSVMLNQSRLFKHPPGSHNILHDNYDAYICILLFFFVYEKKSRHLMVIQSSTC